MDYPFIVGFSALFIFFYLIWITEIKKDEAVQLKKQTRKVLAKRNKSQ